jgi:hypothetical protein
MLGIKRSVKKHLFKNLHAKFCINFLRKVEKFGLELLSHSRYSQLIFPLDNHLLRFSKNIGRRRLKDEKVI